MKTVKQLLDRKGRNVWSISSGATVFEAIKLMNKHGIGALVVLNGEKLAGILSERDYARKVILKGKSSKTTPVKAIMTKKVFTVSPHKTLDDCMVLMTNKRIRHLPVMEGKKLAGIVSIGDTVRAAIEEKEFLIEQLSNYISGT